MRALLRSPLDDELCLGQTLRQHVEELEVPEGAFVVLDPQCPLVPPEFVADLVRRVLETGRPHVAVRPVTDTVKVLAGGLPGGLVGETVDRAGLRRLASPAVLPDVVPLPETLAVLVDGLEDPVLVEAPPLARRVADRSEIALLEALALSL